ncbi:PHD finger protein 7-like isoform X6 [Gallus gallus]|uniref:PHD finger protein 7-like isoform X6 n=1 Tax=Gallus gallus TaxID=9031 RepID=UPI001AE372D9|nr:PHD finger protein 7-like isoform X6 [Gallus gallus]
MLFLVVQIFSTGLCQPGKDNTNVCSFKEDLIRTVRQAEQTLCFVCGNFGATITCAEAGCDRSFHLPCASEGDCITQYFGEFRSFCWVHRPHQAVEAAPAQDTTCIICMEPVGDCRSYSTMVCPSCQHAWFHRACIQEQALRAGIYCFQCPLCRDRDWFIPDMVTMGIRIPFRKPTWEDSDSYASLGVRHQRCDASSCLYPHGREQAEREGPWQLLLCCSCAAQGTHRCCSNLGQSTTTWECNACAGEGTASSTNLDSAGPNTTSQQGLEPARVSAGQESSSSGTTSQAPSGPDSSSRVPELLSQQPGRARTRSRSPHDHRAAETRSQPQRRRRSRSRRRGPAQGRSRSRVPRRARYFNSQPQ